MLFIPFRKVFGLVWYFAVVPFRDYANNVVFNYVLKKGIYLKRLNDRPITEVDNGIYTIQPYHNTQGGYIQYRIVSKLEYFLVFWTLWGWLDNDSTADTWSKNYTESIVNGKRMTWLPKYIIRKLQKDLDSCPFYGNSFDLGDKRSEYPSFRFWSCTLWNFRNTAYNFKYSLHECLPTNKNFFYFKFLGTHWGYLPNGSHKGRLVYFKEYWECKN